MPNDYDKLNLYVKKRFTRFFKLTLLSGVTLIAVICLLYFGLQMLAYSYARRVMELPLADRDLQKDISAIAGQYGDSLGAANAFFSGVALLGVVVAVYLQLRQLAIQQQEIAAGRQEQRNITRALDAQIEMARKTSDVSVLIALAQVQAILATASESGDPANRIKLIDEYLADLKAIRESIRTS